MSGGISLQIIGIIFMLSGSIIAIMDLWRYRIDNIIKKLTKGNLRHLKEWITIIVDIREYMKLKDTEEFNPEILMEKYKKLQNISIDFLKGHFKRKSMDEFKSDFIWLGVTFIILGSILQIVGISL